MTSIQNVFGKRASANIDFASVRFIDSAAPICSGVYGHEVW